MSSPGFITLVCALIGAGCNASPGSASGTEACDASDYPCGSFGTGVGDVIANAALTGRRDENHDGRITDDPARAIVLSDYRGDPSTKVLVLFITTEWCVPCRAEQPELVAISKGLQSMRRVAVLEVLVQNARGSAADQSTIDTWANTYGIPFDMAFDAAQSLGAFYSSDTFPSQLVITTSDMRIRWIQHGITSGALQSAIDAALGQ